MRKSQEITREFLVDRMKNAMKQQLPAEPVDRSAEIIPEMKFRDLRGRMVTVLRVSPRRVVYFREGYQGVSEIRREVFEREFKKVQP